MQYEAQIYKNLNNARKSTSVSNNFADKYNKNFLQVETIDFQQPVNTQTTQYQKVIPNYGTLKSMRQAFNLFSIH